MSKARFPNRLCSRDFFPRLRNKQDYFNSIKEDKIIKRVNGKGYQPLLIGIKNGQFKNEGQSFTLEVTFTSGKTFDSFFPIKGEF